MPSGLKLVVANNYYYLRGGSERVMFDEIESLERRGFGIVAFSRSSPANVDSPYSHLFLPCPDYEQLGALGKVKTAAGILYSRSQRKAFAKVLDASNPDVIHGHNIYGGLTFSIIDEAVSRGVPSVLTLHDLKLVCPSYLMLNHGDVCERCLGGKFWNCTIQRCHKNSLSASLVNTVEAFFNSWRGIYNKIDALLCPSQFLRNKLLQGGIPGDKLLYLPNSIPVQNYEAAAGNDGYVLFAGRLSREKGVMTLLEAAAAGRIPLRIAGKGPVEDEARRFVAAEGLQNVMFEGYCSGETLEKLYQGAAAVVVCSECYENAPMSILEAYAYGKPVVGSNLGGVPELIQHEHTGYLFEAGNADDLADALERCLKRQAELGKNGRRLVETQFSMAKHVDGLMRVYDACLAREAVAPLQEVLA